MSNSIKQKRQIENELEIWEDKLKTSRSMAYVKDSLHDFSYRLKTSMSEDLFTAFRCSVLDNLKLKLIKIEEQFKNL